jgi:zinc transport system substrate-binding protein
MDRQTNMMRLLPCLLAVGIFLLSTGTASARPMDVFVSILPQKYLVEAIGGERVRVRVMVGPGRSPATYEPTPRQMAALSEASLYFRIGVPFEQVWMDRLRAVNPGLRFVDTRDGITLRSIESHVHEHPGPTGGADGGADQGRKDPHIWTSPPLLARQGRSIAHALSEIDPAGESSYAARLSTLEQRLEGLDRELEALLAPHAGSSFLVFHPSWGYFADRYRLVQLPIELGGKPPSARELGQIIDEARAEGIRVVLVQKQFSENTARTVATAIGGRVVTVDPLAEDVVENLREVGKVIAEALRS